jgi:hypothetical protein
MKIQINKQEILEEGVVDNIKTHIANNKNKYIIGGAGLAGIGVATYNGLLGRNAQIGLKKLLPGTTGSRIVDDYESNAVTSFADTALGDVLTGGVGPHAAGLHQGLRTGHPIVGTIFGKAGTLGAASNNVDNINVSDAMDSSHIVGNLGIGAPITALQYGAGKVFGSKEDSSYYTDTLNDHNI